MLNVSHANRIAGRGVFDGDVDRLDVDLAIEFEVRRISLQLRSVNPVHQVQPIRRRIVYVRTVIDVDDAMVPGELQDEA